MYYTQGDRVRAGGLYCEVEAVYESMGAEFLALISPDGYRQIRRAAEVKPAPPAEDPVRRKAVDLILDYNGVKREHLFEYPYNEHESRARIRKAESLLDDLLRVLGPK